MKRWPMHYSAPDKVNETALPASWEMRMMEKATAPMNRALKKSTLMPIHRTLARHKKNAWLCLSWRLEETKWILLEFFFIFSLREPEMREWWEAISFPLFPQPLKRWLVPVPCPYSWRGVIHEGLSNKEPVEQSAQVQNSLAQIPSSPSFNMP